MAPVSLDEMTSLYVFCLVLGGGFLGLSLLGDLFGGHGDVDLGGGGVDASDLPVDAADAPTDAHGGHDGPDHHGVAAKVFSIRTVIYAAFGFGAVGTLLTWLWSGRSPVTTAALAAGTGLASGWLINVAFSWVKRSETGALGGESTFEGHTGRVTLPIEGSGGKVVVEKAGREVELRALAHPSALGRGDPSRWKAVVVVDMKHGVARVAPVDDEPLLRP